MGNFFIWFRSYILTLSTPTRKTLLPPQTTHKPFYGKIEQLVTYQAPNSSVSVKSTTPQKPNSLETLLREKVGGLTEILNQLHSETEHRKHLSKNIVGDIYCLYLYLKSYFLTLDQWGIGHNRPVELRRSRLEQQLLQLRQEVRMEKAQCWKDIANLNKEKRTWLKQYRDLMQKVKIMLPEQFQK